MSKKIIFMFLFLILALTVYSKPVEITVVTDNNYPPYIFVDEHNTPKGILPDLWKKWEEKTGVKVNLVAMDWKEAQKYIMDGKADVIDTIFRTNERENYYEFSAPYTTIEVPVYYNENISGISTVKDLKGFSVAVKEGDACIEVLNKAGILDLELYSSYEEIINRAAKNEIKVFCVDKPPANYYLYKMNIEKNFKIGPTLYSGEFHRAVLKNNIEVLNVVEDGFRKITKSENDKIYNKWMGTKIGNEIRERILYLVMMFGALTFAAITAAYLLGRIADRKTKQLTKALNEIKEKEDKMRAVLSAVPDLLFIQKSDGTYLDYFAQNNEDLFIEKDNIVGHNMYDMPFPIEFKEKIREIMGKVIRDNSLETFEYELDFKGMRKTFEARMTKYSDSEIFCICRNITERKQYEVEIMASREKAEDANRAKSQFLANMSHEIRTPLNGIMGMMQLMRISNLTKEQNEYLNIMEFSSEALLAIINDVLDISKIEAGKMEMAEDEFSLNDLVEGLTYFIAAAAEEKGIEMVHYADKNIPEYIVSDAGKVKQILINVLNNAVKFTDSGEIRFSMYNFKEKDDYVWIRFEIADTGIGIEKGKIDNLFQKFYQADYSSTKRYGGTGLGLAISKEMVKILGGDIDVESFYGKGTTFFITLKFKKSGKKNIQEAIFKREKPVILILDNNNSTLMALSKLLKDEGADVITVDNIPEFEMLIESSINCCFIIDYDIYGVEELIDKMRFKKGIGAEHFAILSPLDKNRVKHFEERYGIKKFIRKPFSRKTILREIGSEPKENGNQTNSQEIEKNKAYTVMIVEDNSVNQVSIASMLGVLGYKYDIFESAEMALDELKTKKYDLILMDIGLPGMDGLEAIKIIRKTNKIENIPVIAVTAYTTGEDKNKCREAGANDYLAKPYRLDELKKKLEKYLK